MRIKVNVPTSLSDIKLGDYQKFVSIQEENDDDSFVLQKMVQIFCDIPLLAVSRMKRKDFNSIASQILTLLEEKPKLVQRFTLDGRDFGFEPDLDNMDLGVYVDVDKYLTDNKNLNKAMAALYRPIKSRKGNKYLIEDYEGSGKNGELMKDLPLNIAQGCVLFFWTLSLQLLSVTPNYSKKLMEKNKAAQALRKSGVGISTFIRSQEEMCSLLKERLSSHLERPSPSLRMTGT